MDSFHPYQHPDQDRQPDQHQREDEQQDPRRRSNRLRRLSRTSVRGGTAGWLRHVDTR